jgi:phosphoglucomutase/phosphomannomutase
MLPAQTPPDGSFAAVRFRVPNPEVRTSLVELIAFAKEQCADLALASDPDADRIGCVAPDAQGEWRFFNGNEIGVLVAYQLLSMRKAEGSLPAQPIVIKTEVTTGLLERLTKSFGGKIVSHLLVGCKFIADVMHNLEHKGHFLDLQGSLNDVIMGTEESHGVLITPTIRDKDAAGAALILADLTSRMKAEGRTLVDAIEDIYQQHGYFSNTQVSMVMEGAMGLTRIRDMQAALRNDPPQSIGGIPVIAFFDHWREDGIFGAIRSETDRSARNVLVFHLEGGVRVILRPSGTEPKAKLYIELASAPTADRVALYKEMAATDARAAEIGGVFAQALLQRIGIHLPRYAFAISDIVPIDLKHRFAQETLPALRAEAERLLGTEGSTAKLLAFAQERFSALNKNAPSLFVDGALAYLRDEKETLPPDLHALLRDAFAAFPR